MNLLQSIPENEYGPVFVTLNPPFEPKQELVADEYWYTHPLFTAHVSAPSDTSACNDSQLTGRVVVSAERRVPEAAARDPEQTRHHLRWRMDQVRLRK